ncbi:M48 family metallopeptidase [Demequina sp.]|uniref:M48 family metallopeptidase n=1 Tax=Demequina sp. TaxID=2050685 RepID=UPI003A841B7F
MTHRDLPLDSAPVPEYVLTRKRMRTIRMRIDSATLEIKVSAPHSTPLRRIDELVASKRAWIERARRETARREPPLERGHEADALAEQVRTSLVEMLPLWCERMGVRDEPRISLKVMRTRWGSCNPSLHKINLNVELARRGHDALEYVLVHELCHLFELNHGPRFYALMDRHLPDWRTRKRALGRL